MSLSRVAQYSSQILIAAAAVAVVLAVTLYVEINRAGSLQTGLDRLKKDYEESNIARGRLATEKEAIERDRNGWRDRAEKAEREGNEVHAKAVETVRLLQAEQQANEKTRSGLAALGREVAAAQAGIGEVTRERDALRGRAEKAEREGSAAQAREADTAGRLQAEQQALEKTRGDLATAQAKIGEVERERDGLGSRAEKAERESSDAQARQAEAARLLQAEQQALEKARGELAAARTEISNKDQEIHRLGAKPGETAAH
jgi:chromosome segregation ATPase